MATLDDVRAIALTLPGTQARAGAQAAFDVQVGPKLRGYCWVWLERLSPRAARVPNPSVLAVRVANLDAKEMLLMADPRKFFTEPHYDGYPAVLLRLSEIGREELRALLTEAWRVLTQKASRARPRANVKLVSTTSLASSGDDDNAATNPRAAASSTSPAMARPRQDGDKPHAVTLEDSHRSRPKSPAAKRLPSKKMAAKDVTSKKVAANKVAAKKVEAQKVATKEVAAKKVAAKKVAAKRVVGKKAAAKKAGVKRAAKR